MTDLPEPIETLLEKLESSIRLEITKRSLVSPALVGVHSGGGWIATLMQKRLGVETPLGLLDISFYRDDFSQVGVHPQVKPSSLPFKVDGRNIILIDDVFFTGRTARAALNEIFDYGRPAQVILAVLLERNGRQIPIKPDCCGGSITLKESQRIKLSGPDLLNFSIHEV